MSGGSPMASGGRDDLAFILLILPLAAGIGVVNTLSELDEAKNAGHALAAWKPAVWEGSSILVISALAPAVMALTRGAWPLARPRWKVAGLHLLGLLAFALIHVTLAGALRWAAYRAVGDFYPPLGPLLNFVYELRKDALIYAGLVVSYVIWRLYRAHSTASLREPAEHAIAVRDGARRHFVPLAEVAWIEAAGNYVELHRGKTPILHRASLSEMERQLTEAGFLRIHRSRLVRRGASAQVESKPSGDFVVRLADGRELAGSRRYRRPLLEP